MMNYGNSKKQPCRNFQRGSCQYGERCKFLHVTQQQPKSNNPFGFGTQQQHHHQKPSNANPFGFGTHQQPHQNVNNPFGFGTQKQHQQHQKPTNPFGFGVQNNSYLKGPGAFGSKQNQFKPFENKWTRLSPTPKDGAPSSQQPDSQLQPSIHICTDPDSCKRLIVEDFENERPLWKLTCYSHWKNALCDIIGDVSYEELRATAYDDARHGVSLQSIVERERNVLNSKLTEFENLLHNPYVVPSKSAFVGEIPFPVAPYNAFSPPGQSKIPPSVSGFREPVAPLNMRQPHLLSSSDHTLSEFGIRHSATSNNLSGQQNFFSNTSQLPSAFQTTNLRSENTGICCMVQYLQMHVQVFVYSF
uniref:Zinc finger CCCH domain-containing protein 16-like isoform X2 n=1 Tax=Rhizophora mucronata TaxID=61149 RepID=A0A2P2JVY1_RHIMU